MIENNEEYKKYMHYTLSEINDQINELQRDVKYLDDLLSNRIKEDIKKYW